MVQTNFQELLANEFRRLLDPLIYAAESELVRQRLFEAIGWDLENSPGFPVTQLSDKLHQTADTVRLLQRYIDSPPQTLKDLLIALDSCADTFIAIRGLPVLLDSLDVEGGGDRFKELSEDLINFLVVRYWARYHPVSFSLALLLTIVRSDDKGFAEQLILDKSGHVVRRIHPRAKVELKRVSALLQDPVGLLKEEYIGEHGLITSADAQYTADKLFPRIARVLHTLGLWAVYGLHESIVSEFDETEQLLGSTMLTTWFQSNRAAADDTSIGTLFGATLAISPKDLGDLGLVVRPFGVVSLSQEFVRWAVTYELTGEVGGFAMGPQGFTSLTDLSTAVLGLRLILDKLSDLAVEEVAEATAKLPSEEEGTAKSKAILVGSTTGTRLEVGGLRLSFDVGYENSSVQFGGLLEVKKAALVISGSDGDGFVNELMPPNEVRAEFDLAIGWSNNRGFYVNGSAGLEGTLPIYVEIAGVLALDSIYVAIQPAADGALRAVTAATAMAELGPFLLVAEKVGLAAAMTFPESGGNLGVGDLQLGFHPPQGIGISIASKLVYGGGYLFRDNETDQYAGVMQISVADKVLLTGIGLLSTPLPGETKGYSLVVILTATGFTPISLGFGFRLLGVGGLLAVNRNASVDALQAGLRDGILDSILFPSDPIAQAPAIVKHLGAIFPVARGKHLIGPMFQIGWGKPTILTIELAVLLQLPAPLQVIVLGQLASILPSPLKPVIKIQVEIFGLIDFEKKTYSVDGLLRDSYLGLYNLHGSMAVRGGWGPTNPGFLISAGGFHPAFQPPANFPKLERMSISLSSGDAFRLILEAYFALTSNTVQLGALVDLHAQAADFSVQGSVSFDALFHFNPFNFETSIHGSVTLSHEDAVLMAISLDVTLSGPSPWHVRGQASFEVLFVKASVRFDHTFGAREESGPAEQVEITPLVVQALKVPGNWTANLPGTGEPLVSFNRQQAPEEVIIHPMGELVVRQNVLPFNLEIEKFGGSAPSAGERRFAITGATMNGVSLSNSLEPETDFFAAAQFLNLSDSEKLTRPSFERLDAGVRLSMKSTKFGQGQTRNLDFETVVVDPAFQTQTTESTIEAVSADNVEKHSKRGAAARSPLRRRSARRYQGPSKGIRILEPKYLVITKYTSAVAAGSENQSLGRSAAFEILRRQLSGNRKNRKQFQVVPAHEVSVV